jgi:hypothetical protein
LIFRVTHELGAISHDITMTRVGTSSSPVRRLAAGIEATQLNHNGEDVLSKLVSADLVGEVRNASPGEPSSS